RQAVEAVMQRWALGQAAERVVLAQLTRLPVSLAVDALVTWSARVPGERWRRLASGLERERWARRVRRNSNSGRWWKRLETARFLSVAATPADTPRLLKLLRDPHPAVHIAAVAPLERVESALGAFPHPESTPALTRLAGDAAWPVRAQAARSLGMLADPATLPLVHAALRDPDWWVRLRSGLALTRFGSAGRNALLAAE